MDDLTKDWLIDCYKKAERDIDLVMAVLDTVMMPAEYRSARQALASLKGIVSTLHAEVIEGFTHVGKEPPY